MNMVKESKSDVLRPLKDTYLSIFVLFFRLGRFQWGAGASDIAAYIGVLGVSSVVVFLAMSLAFAAQAELGSRFDVPQWMVLVIAAGIVASNYILLVLARYGIAFEQKLVGFTVRRRLTLLAVAGVIVVFALVVFIVTLDEYRRVFFVSNGAP